MMRQNKGRDERRDLPFASYLCIIYVEVLLRAADIAQDATHTTRIALKLNVVYTVYLKKKLNAPRPSEHPPVRGKKCQNV